MSSKKSGGDEYFDSIELSKIENCLKKLKDLSDGYWQLRDRLKKLCLVRDRVMSILENDFSDKKDPVSFYFRFGDYQYDLNLITKYSDSADLEVEELNSALMRQVFQNKKNELEHQIRLLLIDIDQMA